MAVINLASKYSQKLQERFHKDSVIKGLLSKDVNSEFVGVKTVRFWDANTAPLNDYTRSGANRYGTPEELGDNVQECTVTQDKSFTFTIDKGNAKEQFNIKQAGASLKRQYREVVTPAQDKYALDIMAKNAGKAVVPAAALSKSTIAEVIMDGSAALDNANVPEDGRFLLIRTSLYKLLKLCDQYVALEKVGTEALVKGHVGKFDNMEVVKVPDTRMPAGVNMIFGHKSVAFMPEKLNDYKIHTDPPGISGALVEGRIIYDCFVKGTRVDGLYIVVDSGLVAADPTITIASGVATIASTTGSAVILYTTDGSDPRYSTTAAVYNAESKPAAPSGTVVKAVATKTGMFRSGLAEAKAS